MVHLNLKTFFNRIRAALVDSTSAALFIVYKNHLNNINYKEKITTVRPTPPRCGSFLWIFIRYPPFRISHSFTAIHQIETLDFE